MARRTSRELEMTEIPSEVTAPNGPPGRPGLWSRLRRKGPPSAKEPSTPELVPEGVKGKGRWVDPFVKAFRFVAHKFRPVVAFLTKSQTRLFLLVASSLVAVSIGLASFQLLAPSLFAALVGFGLALAALLHIAFPPLAKRLDGLPRHMALAAWALLTMSLSLVGFSSTAVIVLVLLIGGFTAGNVYWRFLSRILDKKVDASVEMSAEEKAGRSGRLLFTISFIAMGSLAATFAIGYFRVSDAGPLGRALLFGSGGLVLGLLPTIQRLISAARATKAAAEHLFHLRHLLRDILFTSTVVGLIGYEVSIAADGGFVFGIPALVVVIVLLSYLGILLRGYFTFRDRLKPYDALPQAAFGMLLIFSPIVVVLSSPSITVGRLYGAAQAFGLLAGLIYIGMKAPWREESRRLFDRFQRAVQQRVLPENSGVTKEGSDEGKKGRGKRKLLRRRRREEQPSS